MFKYYSIKKYGTKFLPALEKRYGEKFYYSPSEVRTTVYKDDFNPKFLPLAYLLFLEHKALKHILAVEYPTLNIRQYQQEIIAYLAQKNYHGYLNKLA